MRKTSPLFIESLDELSQPIEAERLLLIVGRYAHLVLSSRTPPAQRVEVQVSEVSTTPPYIVPVIDRSRALCWECRDQWSASPG